MELTEIKRVYIINDDDLNVLLSFAESTEKCINEGRIDLAMQGIEHFKATIEKRIRGEN